MACARAAQNSGVETIVFEKSRGVGGRLATRRPFGPEDPLALDHGAPYAEPSAQYPDTATRLPTLGSAWSGPWPENWGYQPANEVLGVGGMSALARVVAKGSQPDEKPLRIVLQTEIRSVVEGSQGWLLLGLEDGARQPFDAVVAAAPAPQSRNLLGPACPAAETDAVFRPVWSIMAVFDPAPTGARHNAVIEQPEAPLQRVFRQGAKPGRAQDGREAWVGHAHSEWSHFHLEQDGEAVATALLPALRRSIGLSAEGGQAPVYLQAHRWRYGIVSRPIGRPFWISDETAPLVGPLGVCGDWRLGPKAGDALASGERMGAAIAARLLS